MSRKAKYITLNIIALTMCVAPPAVATLYQFPLWVEKGADATVSGLAVFMLFLCALPFVRTIKEALKSPSVKFMWFAVLVILWLLRTIIDEMIVVCAVGFLSNCVGSLFYLWRDKYKAEASK